MFLNVLIGSYISVISVCDGNSNCIGIPNDEEECVVKVNKVSRRDNKYFYNTCHHSNCTCPNLYRHKPLGGCELYFEGALDIGIDQQNITMFQCTSTIQIPSSLVNDLVFDCANGKDEILLLEMNKFVRPRFNCPDTNMLEYYPGHKQCYYKHQMCQYAISKDEHVLTICRNGRHLNNCNTF